MIHLCLLKNMTTICFTAMVKCYSIIVVNVNHLDRSCLNSIIKITDDRDVYQVLEQEYINYRVEKDKYLNDPATNSLYNNYSSDHLYFECLDYVFSTLENITTVMGYTGKYSCDCCEQCYCLYGAHEIRQIFEKGCVNKDDNNIILIQKLFKEDIYDFTAT